MKRSDTVSVIFEGELFKGERSKLIGVFEARGHAAIRAEQSPHNYFQMAEFLKREQDEQALHKPRRQNNKAGMERWDAC